MNSKKLIIAGVMSLALLSSCGGGSQIKDTQQPQTDSLNRQSLIGQTLRIDYGDMQAIVSYQRDSLVWQTSSDSGISFSEKTTEIPTYETMSDGRVVVTWQEATGEVVTQVLNLEKQEVIAFIYAPLSGNQTSRAGVRLIGKITK